MSNSNHIYDCIVIGGGVSGLRCATLLKDANKSVLVLESRDRVGGRTCSVEYEGYKWDVGGQWVGPSHSRLLKLIGDLGQSIFPQQQQGSKVLEFDGKSSKYTGTIPPVSIAGLLELQMTVWRLDKMSMGIDVKAPWKCKNAKEWDSVTVQQWVDKNLWSTLAKKMMHVAITSVFSTDPNEISLLFMLTYIAASGNNMMYTLDVKNGAQQDRVLGSVHQLSLTMAEKLTDSIVKLDHRVNEINYLDPTNIVVSCTNGSIFNARKVVITAPPILINRINFQPQLPMERQHFNQRMQMGQVIKFIIFYDKCFWRELGFAGEIMTDRESVSIAFDATFEDGSRPSIVGFFEGSAARHWSDKTEAERKAEVINLLHKSFGDDRVLHPTNYMEKDWMKEADSLGGYTGVCAPGVLTTVYKCVRQPVGNIHFAGTETATQWCGYIEGALESAERVSSEILEGLTK